MLYEIILDKSKLNDYKIGRISGMIRILSGQPEKEYAQKHDKSRNICHMFFETDSEGLHKIQEAIERTYPGVIISEDD